VIKILSTVNEALLRIGKKTDAASAAGSLHAKVRNLSDVLLATKYRTIASSNLKASSDLEVSNIETNFIKAKEICLNIPGSIRVAYALKAYDAASCSGQIYVNYVPVGTLRTTSSTSYTTYTEDITVKPGDFVQVFIKTTASFGYIQNFRIYYDEVVINPADEFVVIL
jgi:hypothetical protein